MNNDEIVAACVQNAKEMLDRSSEYLSTLNGETGSAFKRSMEQAGYAVWPYSGVCAGMMVKHKEQMTKNDRANWERSQPQQPRKIHLSHAFLAE